MTHSSARRTKSSFWSKLATVAIFALLWSAVTPIQETIATTGDFVASLRIDCETGLPTGDDPHIGPTYLLNVYENPESLEVDDGASCDGDVVIYDFGSATSILDSAFEDSTLTSIHIASTVTSIGTEAFKNARSLATVTFAVGSQLESIGMSAFYVADDDSSLESITIPSSVTNIGAGAFRFAVRLTSVSFAEDSQLLEIPDNAFANARSLTAIRIPSSVTSIGESAFRNTLALESVTFEPDSTLETIGDSAFSIYDSDSGSLTSIRIPNSVTLIGNGAFQNSALRSILFQDGIDPLEIDLNAFKDADFLESIEIPNRVTGIGEGAFSFTDSLRSVTFAPGISLSELSRQLFWRADSLNAITVPDSVFSIHERAFAETSNLISVTFGPDSILRNIEIGAFEDSTALEEIEIPTTVEMIGDSAFRGATSLASVTFGAESILGSLGENAFRGASSLAHIDLPNNDLEVAKYAFYGTAPSLFSSSYVSWKSPLARSAGSADIGDKVYASAFEKRLSISGLGPHIDEYVYRITTSENVSRSSVDRQAITSYTPLDKGEQDAWYADLGFDEVNPYDFAWRAFMCVNNEGGTSTVTRPTNLSLSYASRDVIPVGTSSQNHWALFRNATQALHLASSPSTRTAVGKIYDGESYSPPKGSDMYELDYNNSPYSLGISEVHATCGTGKTLEALQIVQPEELGTNPITTKELEITPVLRLTFEGEYFTENSAGLTIGVTGGGGGGPGQFGGSYNAALWGLTTIAGGELPPDSPPNGDGVPASNIGAGLGQPTNEITRSATFASFLGNSSQLPINLRNRILRFSSGFKKVTRVECTGYTSGLLPTPRTIALAKSRAKASCDLIKREHPKAKVQLRVKPATGVGSTFRRVQVKVVGS